MSSSIKWNKAARPLRLGLLAVLAMGFSSCASAIQPCAQGEPGIKTVGGHNAFRFRQDWKEFRADLADFREIAKREDAQELNTATSELLRSITDIRSYSPTSEGKACEAFTAAKVRFDAAEAQLEQVALSTDWPVANELASELTTTSAQLREALPSSWFTRHRHGRHFH